VATARADGVRPISARPPQAGATGFSSFRLTAKIARTPSKAGTGQQYPACIQGERACPPEDVGGIGGYAYFLEAVQDPTHPEHDSYLEWIGGRFDPEAFDLEQVNRRLRLVGRGRK
jgi:hypothetical protein